MTYRPWGTLGWVTSLSNSKRWRFVGVIGTEERSLTAWEYSRSLGLIEDQFFLSIRDAYSEKFEAAIEAAMDNRLSRYQELGGDLKSIRRIDLMAELFRVIDYAKEVSSECSSVIFDITSFPKRFFFPILRRLVESENVENLILTYSSPESHAPAGEPLYEDTEPWRTLPGFNGKAADSYQWVVSVGFMVESLRQYIGEDSSKMKLLIPFPAPLASLRRTWEAIANLEQGQTDDRFEKYRVDTLNLSDAFDRIVSIASGSVRPTAFAPFGPKPASAAICLYAMQTDSPVYYQQPTVYNPNYSRGIHNNDPECAINAYWIKHNGTNLYKL
jgi:hypothetical protein